MASEKFVIADTSYGPVKGVKKTTILGRDYFSFDCIPYMKSPVGKLRFRDAKEPDKWSEPLDVSGERPSYLIYNKMTSEVDGQEDAGIISISTPYLSQVKPLPVAVYIHGGGFQFAYGTWDMFGCDYLLQKDIILVTLNYRVGPIGFLSLKDPELNIPGNAGLKDQVFALKWIQKNIANFGGDPENVTIFGTSVSFNFQRKFKQIFYQLCRQVEHQLIF
jgi:carboxylesterase type B